MTDIQLLKNTWLFKQLDLKADQTLFDIWDINNCLYVLETWELSIEVDLKNWEKKQLAILSNMTTFWEGSLNNSDPKEVRIKATKDSKLLYIDIHEQLEDLLTDFPKVALSLFKSLIGTWNKRLLESNALIASSYEMDQEIHNIWEINKKNIFWLLDSFKSISHSQRVLFFTQNPVMNEYSNFTYDTNTPGKLYDLSLFTPKGIDKSILEENKLILYKNQFISELSIWDLTLWYLVLEKDSIFDNNEIKIIKTMSSSLSWVFRQLSLLEENKNMHEI